VITPPNRLQGAVGRAIDGDDPVARAEAALAQLSAEFSSWMNEECEQLDRARRNVHLNGMAALPRDALFRSAHDIKGQAATLGFPLVADVAGSLCRLLEETHDPTRIPLDLVDQHVDAVRAIIREHGRARAEVVAATLTRTLRQVCEDFLAGQQPQTSDVDG
jgi:chemotaxis protein histidine kinase CheA